MEKIQFDQQASKIETVLYFCLSIMTIFWLVLANMLMSIKVISIVMLLGYIIYIFKHYAFNNGRRFICLSSGHEKRWVLLQDNKKLQAKLKTTSIITPWVLILSFQTARYFPITFVLFPGSLPNGMFRKLLLVLRTL